MQGGERAISEALSRGDLAGAAVTDAERRLLELVRLLTVSSYRTTAEDLQALRDVGWSDEQLAEAVYITALFAFFNRVADAFGLQDPQYFATPPLPSNPAS